MSKLLHVSINRAKWDVPPNKDILNIDDDLGMLIRPKTGTMCCLGFVGLACGIKKGELVGASQPTEVPNKKWPIGVTGTYGNPLMSANDRDPWSNTERETAIKNLGLEAGIRFTFRGKYLTKKDSK